VVLTLSLLDGRNYGENRLLSKGVNKAAFLGKSYVDLRGQEGLLAVAIRRHWLYPFKLSIPLAFGPKVSEIWLRMEGYCVPKMFGD